MTMVSAYQHSHFMSKPLKYGPYHEQGKVFQARRNALGLSQMAVANIYGGQQSYISEIERGWVNFGGADLVWFERMAVALQCDVLTLMRDLDVAVVISSAENEDQTTKHLPKTAPSGYASVIIEVAITGDSLGANVRKANVIVTNQIAQLHGLAGLEISKNYIGAGNIGQIAVYARVDAEVDDIVVVEFEGGLHLAYFSDGGYVATDQPITPRTPLEFKPTAVVGVVQDFISASRPRRTKILS
jgi:transcriptional regulator with XRE-family HTH domain